MHGQPIDRFYAKPTDAGEGSNATLTANDRSARRSGSHAGVCTASTTGNGKSTWNRSTNIARQPNAAKERLWYPCQRRDIRDRGCSDANEFGIKGRPMPKVSSTLEWSVCDRTGVNTSLISNSVEQKRLGGTPRSTKPVSWWSITIMDQTEKTSSFRHAGTRICPKNLKSSRDWHSLDPYCNSLNIAYIMDPMMEVSWLHVISVMNGFMEIVWGHRKAKTENRPVCLPWMRKKGVCCLETEKGKRERSWSSKTKE